MPEIATPLTDKINALASYANEVTGKNENLSDAVRTLCEGYMPDGITLEQMATHSIPVINNPTINAENIIEYSFKNCNTLTGILNLPNATNVGAYAFDGCTGITEIHAPKITTFGTFAFSAGVRNSTPVHFYFDSLKALPTNGFGSWAYVVLHIPLVEEFKNMCFNGAYGYLGANNGFVIVPSTVKILGSDLTRNTWDACKGYKFYGKPDTIDTNMVGTSKSATKDIYVPWSEGEVEGAPWGGVNATIHYNTTYDSDGNVISST